MDSAVEIEDLPVAFAEVIENGLEEVGGVGIEEGGGIVGEPFADISECCGAEEGVDNSMEEYISIAVTIESKVGICDDDTAEDEWSVGDGAVCVVSFTDAEGWW
ncbi:MAG: hypothetical protein RLZZ458_813 [Planctomycetota bacterium]